MKRGILVLLAVLLPLQVLAGNVSPARAGKVAANFFISRGLPDKLNSLSIPVKSEGDEPYYIFNNASANAFVIVSGDDATVPVLAYSFESVFSEPVPDNLAEWLDYVRDVICSLRREQIETSAEVRVEWQALEKPAVTKAVNAEGGKTLNTALWGQGAPFNDLCPKVDGDKSVAGCVAVATGIIMKYHEWPETGNGRLPDYTYETKKGNTRTQEGHALGHEYDWKNMLMEYQTGRYSRKEASAVSQLIYDIGVAMNMKYDSDGSSSLSAKIMEVLIKHFRYDENIKGLYLKYSTLENWIQTIKTEIDAGRPICYSVRTDDSGHAFVVDGYNSSSMLHINWGWSGNDNGFYAMPEFHVGKHNYKSNHYMVTGIRKYEGTSSSTGTLGYDDISMNPSRIVPGIDFSITLTNIREIGGAAYKGMIGLFLVDMDGTPKEMLGTEIPVSVSSGHYFPVKTIYLKMDKAPATGEAIVPYCRNTYNDEWKQMLCSSEGSGNDKVVPGKVDLVNGTSLTYHKENRIMTVNTLDDAEVILLDKYGVKVDCTIRRDQNQTDIDLSPLKEGKYQIYVSLGFANLSIDIKK